MTPIPLTPNETWKYQLVDDRLPGADGKRTKDSAVDPAGTLWTLQAIPAWLDRQITNLIEFKDGQKICPNRGEVMELQLKHGVSAVERFGDVVIKRVMENNRLVSDLSFTERLSHAHQVELANAVDQRTKVPEADQD